MNTNLDRIGSAMLMLYDELKNDKASKKLLKQIDIAKDGSVIKSGIITGIKRLRELDKNALADDIEEKIKGAIF